MKLRILLAALLAISTPACSTTSLADFAAGAAGVAAPATYAERTMLDEQAMLSVELAYKAARLAGETAVDAGLIKGDTARRIAVADNTAYAALMGVRSAYQAGNAPGYGAALNSARASVDTFLSLIRSR